jgi:hypothetical protein
VYDFIITSISRVHLTALAFPIHTNPPILAMRFTLLGYKLNRLLNNNVCTLNNSSKLSFKFHLYNSIFHNTFGQLELSWLISNRPPASEFRRLKSRGSQRNIIFTISWDSYRAVSIFGNTFYSPLEIVSTWLLGQIVRLPRAIICSTINTKTRFFVLWDIGKRTSFWL